MTIAMKATWPSRKNVQHWSVWLNSELYRKMKTTVNLEYSKFFVFYKGFRPLGTETIMLSQYYT